MNAQEEVDYAHALGEEARLLAAEIIAGMDAQEVGDLCWRMMQLTEDVDIGSAMFAVAELVAGMAEQAPNDEMFMAVFLVMFQSARAGFERLREKQAAEQ